MQPLSVILPDREIVALWIMQLVSLFALAAPSYGSTCQTLTPTLNAKLAAYVASRYEFAPDVSIQDEGLVGETCFRRLTFQSRAPKKSIVLYLSPDQSFLTSELFDIGVDPGAERSRVARQTQRELTSEPSRTKGSASAPVTIVEFSDFQCPFCKNFDDSLKNLGAYEPMVRIVFKEFPLPSHSWSRQAALAAICADRQGEEAFWKLHDFFFANQGALSEHNFDERLTSFLATSDSGIPDTNRLQGCLAGREAESTLLRDQLLAQRYHVEETPAVFINGRRTVGFRNAEELRAAVRQIVDSLGPNDSK